MTTTDDYFTFEELQTLIKHAKRCEIVTNQANQNMILYEKIGGVLSQIPRDFIKSALANNDFDELFNTPTIMYIN